MSQKIYHWKVFSIEKFVQDEFDSIVVVKYMHVLLGYLFCQVTYEGSFGVTCFWQGSWDSVKRVCGLSQTAFTVEVLAGSAKYALSTFVRN
jgi:hypothetical protein